MFDIKKRHITFDSVKNAKLRRERGVDFDTVLSALENNAIYRVTQHPNPEKYPHQFVCEVVIGDYIYIVPFVLQGEHGIFFQNSVREPQSDKKTQKDDPMKKNDRYAFEDEADIEAIEAFERGELVPVKNQAAMKAMLKEAAINYRKKKEARINIRLPETDLEGLKLRAEEEGMPYQTLIASILHKFVTGRLTSKPLSGNGKRS